MVMRGLTELFLSLPANTAENTTTPCPTWSFNFLSLDLLAVPIVAPNRLGKSKIRLFGPDAFLLSSVHECFEVVRLGMFVRTLSACVSAKND